MRLKLGATQRQLYLSAMITMLMLNQYNDRKKNNIFLAFVLASLLLSALLTSADNHNHGRGAKQAQRESQELSTANHVTQSNPLGDF